MSPLKGIILPSQRVMVVMDVKSQLLRCCNLSLLVKSLGLFQTSTNTVYVIWQCLTTSFNTTHSCAIGEIDIKKFNTSQFYIYFFICCKYRLTSLLSPQTFYHLKDCTQVLLTEINPPSKEINHVKTESFEKNHFILFLQFKNCDIITSWVTLWLPPQLWTNRFGILAQVIEQILTLRFNNTWIQGITGVFRFTVFDEEAMTKTNISTIFQNLTGYI